MRRVDTGADELFRAEFPRLAGWAATLVGDDDLGRDIAQDAFVKLLTKRSMPDDPVPYLFRIALNVVRDRWRHQQVVTRAVPLLVGAATVPGPDVSVRDAVDRLPPDLRDACVLHYFADLPVGQVAEILRRPPGTVSRWLSEARAELRFALEQS